MQQFKQGARNAERGFSLAELLVSLAMLAMVSLAAMPSVASITGRNRVEDSARQIQQTLSRARMSAINGGNNYVISFVGTGWNSFNDLDSDGVRDSNEPWVYSTPFPLGKKVSFSAPAAAPIETNLATAGCKCVEYLPLGMIKVSASTTTSQAIFIGDGKAYRKISLSTGGAITVARWVGTTGKWESIG